ncbi:MAG TPA: helix-turn-helix transcriptional regulator [Microthrixaceae bacterium]|nr:helix-turn-helix transcriptional regulator [Microthrixaceae bacterium]
MDAGPLIRTTRRGAGLTLRALAAKAGTSHSTLAAYEAERVTPSASTLDRILRSCGVDLVVEARPSIVGPDPAARGRELVEVLDLAAQFPARHSRQLQAPVFGR